MNSSPPEPDDSDRICFECVGEEFLEGLIQREGTPEECAYCGEKCPTISIEELADHVERAFADHFERTPTEPEGWEWALISDREINYKWERSGRPVEWALQDALGAEEDVADAVRSILEVRHCDHSNWKDPVECEFSEGAHYREKAPGNGEYADLWYAFEKVIKTESRYFSRKAVSILERIFEGISDLRSTLGTNAVVIAGPNTELNALFRARVFAGEDKILECALETPWLGLGTPPATLAGAGRMNARGIAVFYGAQNAETALAEARPPVGSQVAVARFDLIRDLRLLDLNALRSVAVEGSIFDRKTINQMQMANFLEILSRRMSRAIMPHEEVSEYLPTQAVAEYLANEAGLDGMIFPSVQAGQTASNVVLFHDASRVEEVQYPPGTKIGASLTMPTGDGDLTDYRRWIRIPEEPPIKKADRYQDFLDLDPFDDSPVDDRNISLRIDLNDIRVLHIKAVSFQFDTYSVKSDQSIDRNYDHLGSGP